MEQTLSLILFAIVLIGLGLCSGLSSLVKAVKGLPGWKEYKAEPEKTDVDNLSKFLPK